MTEESSIIGVLTHVLKRHVLILNSGVLDEQRLSSLSRILIGYHLNFEESSAMRSNIRFDEELTLVFGGGTPVIVPSGVAKLV